MTNEEVVKEIKDKAYAAGFRAAKEKAKGIALEHQTVGHICDDAKDIAQCIGSLEP